MRSIGGRAATRISSGPGPAAAMLNDEFADTNSVFASAVSLRDEELTSENHEDASSANGDLLRDRTDVDKAVAAETLTLLPKKFLADPDNSSYEDLLLQIYGPDAGKLFA